MDDGALLEIERWLRSLDERRANVELEDLERRAKELEAQIEADTAELREVEERVTRSRAALELRDMLSNRSKTTTQGSAFALGAAMSLFVRRAMARQEEAGERPARGRESVRALIKEMPEVEEWTVPLVLKELVVRGWADPGDKHAVGVSLSRMARKGEFVRPRKGIYVPVREHVQKELAVE